MEYYTRFIGLDVQKETVVQGNRTWPVCLPIGMIKGA